jgi:hypothetical protein
MLQVMKNLQSTPIDVSTRMLLVFLADVSEEEEQHIKLTLQSVCSATFPTLKASCSMPNTSRSHQCIFNAGNTEPMFAALLMVGGVEAHGATSSSHTHTLPQLTRV